MNLPFQLYLMCLVAFIGAVYLAWTAYEDYRSMPSALRIFAAAMGAAFIIGAAALVLRVL